MRSLKALVGEGFTVGSGGPVVCFGEMMLRLAPPGVQLVAQASVLEVQIAGAEGNVAAALASLGNPALMVSRIAANPLGRRARSALAAAGVDVAHMREGPGRMGLYFLEVGAGLRPSAITYDRAGSAFAEAAPEDFDFAGALVGASLLHVSGITPALGPKGVALAHAAVAAAKAAGVPVCFDGNYRANLWSAWECDPAAILRDLVAEATILIGNHRDISLLLGKRFDGGGADRRREAAEAALAEFPGLQIIASTAREVVDSGHHRIAARVDLRDDWHQTAAAEVTGIIDRIGSGDAFAAGMLHRWLRGANAQRMAEGGLALTALKHSVAGDLCLLGEAEFEAFNPAGGDVRR